MIRSPLPRAISRCISAGSASVPSPDARIDHRSLEAQGIALEPQSQIGASAKRIEDRDFEDWNRTEVVERWRDGDLSSSRQGHWPQVWLQRGGVSPESSGQSRSRPPRALSA
ncbi:MobA/MobL family protein [Bradyrhizobium sp. UFLA05-112]